MLRPPPPHFFKGDTASFLFAPKRKDAKFYQNMIINIWRRRVYSDSPPLP